MKLFTARERDGAEERERERERERILSIVIGMKVRRKDDLIGRAKKKKLGRALSFPPCPFPDWRSPQQKNVMGSPFVLFGAENEKRDAAKI